MFRIRQITEAALPLDHRELEEVQRMLRERFPGLSQDEIDALPRRLVDPLAHRLRLLLLVADDLRGNLKGFALLSHAPDLNFWLLDFVAAGKGATGAGIGGALYDRVREIAREAGGIGLFFECLPDDPEACSHPALAKGNAARLSFYERFGARPIIGTGYETPLQPSDKDLPHLVFDDLGSGRPLRRDELRAVIRAILERKYAHLCPPEYVERIVASVTEDPVRVRPPRYQRSASAVARLVESTAEQSIALVVNDRHDIHHVKERGYVEAPVRVRSILDGILPTGLFARVEPREWPESWIRAVHDDALVDYLKRASRSLPEGRSIYPYVFPIRNATKPPKDLAYGAGYFCIDTFTPINRNAFDAARRAVDCALTAAEAVLHDQRLAYALVRPPGHHAERKVFGGFCYFCNGGIAAHYLSQHGRVAILDLDYHHGNGQQDIFFARDDVLTVSIHGHPSFAYPFFTGFPEEVGVGPGEGFNLNLPLPEQVDGSRFLKAMEKALVRISVHAPRFLVVSLGFDTAKGDPTGSWSLGFEDFEAMGRRVGALGLRTLVVQEGGYRTTTLRTVARAFFRGLHAGAFAPKNSK
ncbi:MAG: acetylpolyamine amidohydrolase [Planctomycetes bacterium]|nr:acetylpolyamine amidohydrolase [Planctomycetota bacterium]